MSRCSDMFPSFQYHHGMMNVFIIITLISIIPGQLVGWLTQGSCACCFSHLRYLSWLRKASTYVHSRCLAQNSRSAYCLIKHDSAIQPVISKIPSLVVSARLGGGSDEAIRLLGGHSGPP